MHPLNHDNQLQEFLGKAKEKKVLNVRDMTGDEISLAEELVSKKLLTKYSTRVTTIYSYGVVDAHVTE